MRIGAQISEVAQKPCMFRKVGTLEIWASTNPTSHPKSNPCSKGLFERPLISEEGVGLGGKR